MNEAVRWGVRVLQMQTAEKGESELKDKDYLLPSFTQIVLQRYTVTYHVQATLEAPNQTEGLTSAADSRTSRAAIS